METVGEPYGFYPKLLKWKHFVPSVPKSLGQQALRKIRSLERFPAVCPPTRSTAASLKHRRCWAFPARHLGLRIVANEEIGGPKATTKKISVSANGFCDSRLASGLLSLPIHFQKYDGEEVSDCKECAAVRRLP
jgi:hypothetical protein